MQSSCGVYLTKFSTYIGWMLFFVAATFIAFSFLCSEFDDIRIVFKSCLAQIPPHIGNIKEANKPR